MFWVPPGYQYFNCLINSIHISGGYVGRSHFPRICGWNVGQDSIFFMWPLVKFYWFLFLEVSTNCCDGQHISLSTAIIKKSNVATTRLNSAQHLKIYFHHFFASFYYLFYHSQIPESSKCSPSYEGLPSGYSIQPCPISLETSPPQVQALCLLTFRSKAVLWLIIWGPCQFFLVNCAWQLNPFQDLMTIDKDVCTLFILS